MTTDQRIHILKELLLKLHHGATPESIQEEFNTYFSDVSAIEIALMEQQLVFDDNNDITYEDVLQMCNVHANLFKGKIDDQGVSEADLPGHPVRVYKNENAALQAALLRVENILKALSNLNINEEIGLLNGLEKQFNLVGEFEKHYNRKESVFFPFLERHGYDAPPKVMWAKDDEIRELYYDAQTEIKKLPDQTTLEKVKQVYEAFAFEFREMIFKEEAILLNILLEALSTDEWYQIAQESKMYGYAIIPPEEEWKPETISHPDSEEIDTNTHTMQSKLPEVTMQNHSNSLSEESPVESLLAYKLAAPHGQLMINIESNHTSPKYDYDAPIEHPFTHGMLNLNQVQWLFDYVPFKMYFFDSQGFYRYSNTKWGFPSLPIYAGCGKELNNHYSEIYNNKIVSQINKMVANFQSGDNKIYTFYTENEDYSLVTQFIAVYDDQQIYLGFLQVDEDISALQSIDVPTHRDIDPVNHSIKIRTNSPVLSYKELELTDEDIQLQSKRVSFDNLTITLTYEEIQEEISPELALPYESFRLSGGQLSFLEINGIFNALQGEITFVDRDNLFVFYNNHVPHEQMYFKRNPAQLKRDLEFCHPPKLWPKINKLVQSFKRKEKKQETIWFTKPTGELIHIMYIPIFDGLIKYQGILEIVRDIQPLRSLNKQSPSLL
ncbi:DUF438 domain-containing protein [Aerococcaceae bacterium DSM 111020]|nr:DUF438 domain-containing protein [Aerococcaceae bacterium DSM 111020]